LLLSFTAAKLKVSNGRIPSVERPAPRHLFYRDFHSRAKRGAAVGIVFDPLAIGRGARLGPAGAGPPMQ